MLALADRLQISCVVAACEQFLVSQLNHGNVIQALFLWAPHQAAPGACPATVLHQGRKQDVSLCRADKHTCMNLRQAAIPLAATNFDRIDPEQLVLLPFADFKELLASDQLSTAEVCACILQNAQALRTRERPTASCVCSRSNCAGTLPV